MPSPILRFPLFKQVLAPRSATTPIDLGVFTRLQPIFSVGDSSPTKTSGKHG
jgi:hypothetical protein